MCENLGFTYQNTHFVRDILYYLAMIFDTFFCNFLYLLLQTILKHVIIILPNMNNNVTIVFIRIHIKFLQLNLKKKNTS